MKNEQSTKRQEVGYVLLEECNVLIPSNATCHTTVDPQNAYHSINIQGMDNNYKDISVICEGDGCNNNINRDGCDDLILQPRLFKDNRSNNMNIEDEIDKKFTSWESVNGSITPFNGLLSEIYICEEESMNNTKKRKKSTSSFTSNSSSSPSSSRRRRRRSDASLLVALSVEINNQADEYEEQLRSSISSINDPSSRDNNNLHLRQLRTKDIQIMFWGEDEPSLSNTQGNLNVQFDNEKDDTPCCSGDGFVRMKASLLVTYSLPIIYDDDQNAVPLGEEHNEGRKQIPKKVKRLSSGHQLLGSIIRCDWEYLDVRMKKLQQKALAAEKNALTVTSSQVEEQKKSSRKPFFPDSLNVGELYERISGASKYFDQDTSEEGNESNAIDNADAATAKDVEFLDLPEDIISTSIAPYLRAPSLHALRVSNRKMYKCLRANVPGLKLKLFQHQIRSLEWMEMRERQCITEDDVLRKHNKDKKHTSDYFLHGGESVCGGIPHI